MSRLRPSANYIIVKELYYNTLTIYELKNKVPKLYKRLYDLKKMWFEFNEYFNKETDVTCLDMISIPDDLYIDHDKQIIKVWNYWNDYRNNLDMQRIEEEYTNEFYCNATPSQLLWFEFKESVKNYFTKLFK